MTKTNSVFMIMGWFVLALFLLFLFGSVWVFSLLGFAILMVLIGGALQCLKSSS